MTAWSGTYNTNQAWASGDTMTGNVIINGGATFSSPAAAAGGTLSFTGLFYIQGGSGTNGNISFVGGSSPAARCILEASTNQRAAAWYDIVATLTGNLTLQWCTFRNCRSLAYLGQTGGVITMTDLTVENSQYILQIQNTAVPSTTFARIATRRLTLGGVYIPVATTNAHVFNDFDVSESYSGLTLIANNTATITANRFRLNGVYQAFYRAGAGTAALEIDDCYGGGCRRAFVETNSATGNITVTNSVGKGVGGTTYIAISNPAGGIASSNSDYTGSGAIGLYGLASCVDDHIAGCNGADRDNVDIDTGNTTSTSTPSQYQNFTTNRGTAAATPNKPLTISNTNTPTPTSTSLGTFTWNTGIRSNGLVLVSATTHTSLSTSGTPEELEGRFLNAYETHVDEGLNDWTGQLTGTQAQMKEAGHSVQVNGVQAGTPFYCRRAGYDPLGRFFVEATETTVTTGAAAAAGGGSDTRSEFVKGFRSS